MPVSVTKNKKTKSELRQMCMRAFPEKEMLSVNELSEGFFNAAYRIMLSDGKEVILKIAPPPEQKIMTHEKDIMSSEVQAMDLIKKHTDLLVPKVLYYDPSHEICDSDYFFMELLEGASFSSTMDQLTQEQRDSINTKMGQYTKKMNQIHGKCFGYYGQPEKQGTNWYEVFTSMISDTYEDAMRLGIEIPIERKVLLELLQKDKSVFEIIKVPTFVHWDLWAGNVFQKDGNVTGIIDFERCLWADELMEVGFRTYGYDKAFFDGYGRTELNEQEKRRAEWYDIYLFLISCLESDYRQYDNRFAYDWGSKMLKEWLQKLEN